jgi:carboxyl-terminal processing protease
LEQEQGAFKGTEKKNRRFFIDLRGNTGGVMEQGARSAELFLNAGKTVYRLKNNHGINEVKAAKSGLAANNRFVIMQDYLTASAAEMMIAALKAGANVGTYGERSAGKARVQDVFRLSDGSFLKLTVGELLYPDSDADRDTNWEGSGIVPDVEKRH